jgi:hypothetical protein
LVTVVHRWHAVSAPALLSEISWWMRLLQQRVDQLCNREDNQTGALWQSRVCSVLLLVIALQFAAMSNVAMVVIATQ